MEEKYRDRKDEPEWWQTSEEKTNEEKKDLLKFDSSTDRDKANTSVSQTSSIFESSASHTGKRVYFEFTQTFPLSCSPMTRNEFVGSLNVLHHLRVRHAGVYPADQLPSVNEITNTGDHDRPG